MKINNNIQLKKLFFFFIFSFQCSLLTFTQNTYDAAQVALIPSNENPIIAGSTTITNTNYAFIARYLSSNGVLDTSFANNGIALVKTGTGATTKALAIQPSNEKIVTGGSALIDGLHRFCLIRYNTDGTLDNTFGTNGITTTTINDGCDINALALQSDEKIVVAGFSVNNGKPYITLARYTTAGILDKTFGTNGVVTTDIGFQSFALNIALQTNGKIIVVGKGNSTNFTTIRYNSDGTLDGTFGANGIVQTTLPGFTFALDVKIQTNGKIISFGKSENTFTLIRYNSDGTLDGTFGTNGIVQTSFSHPVFPSSLAIQSDGKIITAGLATETVQLVRYNTDGTVDTTYGNNGIVALLDHKGMGSPSITLQNNGEVVVAGASSQEVAYVANIKTSGKINLNYGNTGGNKVVIVDQKSTGTNGGSSQAKTWITRTLNTIIGNPSFVTLTNNQFTLLPGKYNINAQIPAYRVRNHLARLYNVTENKVEQYGSSAFTQSASDNFSTINAEISIDVATTYEIHHKTKLKRRSDGLGVATGYGDTEIYSKVEITHYTN